LVIGRRTFDIAKGWSDRHLLDVPHEWVTAGAPFTFVMDGVESAVAQARQAAGDKNVGVGAASIAQQCIKAGLLDEIHIDLVPVLLGAGIRLFEHLGTEPIDLECTRVIEAPGVTHLRFRIVK
jgi:dihydrofolate reductase